MATPVAALTITSRDPGSRARAAIEAGRFEEYRRGIMGGASPFA